MRRLRAWVRVPQPGVISGGLRRRHLQFGQQHGVYLVPCWRGMRIHHQSANCLQSWIFFSRGCRRVPALPSGYEQQQQRQQQRQQWHLYMHCMRPGHVRRLARSKRLPPLPGRVFLCHCHRVARGMSDRLVQPGQCNGVHPVPGRIPVLNNQQRASGLPTRLFLCRQWKRSEHRVQPLSVWHFQRWHHPAGRPLQRVSARYLCRCLGSDLVHILSARLCLPDQHPAANPLPGRHVQLG